MPQVGLHSLALPRSGTRMTLTGSCPPFALGYSAGGAGNRYVAFGR